jgi:hypothetical protein
MISNVYCLGRQLVAKSLEHLFSHLDLCFLSHGQQLQQLLGRLSARLLLAARPAAAGQPLSMLSKLPGDIHMLLSVSQPVKIC